VIGDVVIVRCLSMAMWHTGCKKISMNNAVLVRLMISVFVF
jgi:hypothetical protein